MTDERRRWLVRASVGLAVFAGSAGLAGIARGATLRPDSMDPARRGLELAVRSGFAPGFVGLIARGADVDVMPVGRMAIDGPPMRRDTIFRIASMTKPITAAAVMMLIDDGKLRLDEPVDRLLPELANRRVLRRLEGPIDDTVPARRLLTVEDLLTFRLGWGLLLAPPDTYPIQRAISELGIVGFGPPDPAMPFDANEWMRRLGTLPLLAQPGDAWLYTTGSNIQGVLIARASKQPLSAFLADRVFAPLGMHDTGFHVPAAKIDRLATAYRPQAGKLVLSDEPVHGKWSRPPQFEAGDSGLVSTADDYLAFARLLLAEGRHQGRQLLSSAAVKAMTTNHLTPQQRKGGAAILGKQMGWGYGMSISADAAPGQPAPGSIGWMGGLGTLWRSNSARDRTAILLTQRELESPTPAPLYDAFERAAGLR
ncbi:MAG: beta-lactamase family protein [Chitinophagaceae bacterium]|nr:beta-lactamase family protein [Rubrivivax sp.]